MDEGLVALGQAIGSLDPVALIRFVMVDLFSYKTRKILQGVKFSVKMIS